MLKKWGSCMERNKFNHTGVLRSLILGNSVDYLCISISGSGLYFVKRLDESAAHPRFKVVINSMHAT